MTLDASPALSCPPVPGLPEPWERRGGSKAAGAHRSGGRSMSVRMVTRRLLSRAAAAPAALLSSSRGFFRATCPARGRRHMARFSKRACPHAAPGSPVEHKTVPPNMSCEPAALCRPKHHPPQPAGAAQPQSLGCARGCSLHRGVSPKVELGPKVDPRLARAAQHSLQVLKLLQQRERGLGAHARHARHVVRRVAAQRQHVRPLHAQPDPGSGAGGFAARGRATCQGPLDATVPRRRPQNPRATSCRAAAASPAAARTQGCMGRGAPDFDTDREK